MLYTLSIIVLVIISLGLIGVVLIQSGRGGGLSGAFGTGEGQAVFGSRAGDVLTHATTWFAVLFMVLCLLVAYVSKHAEDSIMRGVGSSASSSRGGSAPLMTLAEREALEQTNAMESVSQIDTNAPLDETVGTVPEMTTNEAPAVGSE